MADARLYTLAPSHYCERARWGLDHAGIPFTERVWAPGLHVPLARRIAPGTSLPILTHGDAVVQGSDAILTWAGLAIADARLERRFETVIGPLLRQYVYAGTLHDPRSGVRAALLDGASPVQAALARAGWPAIRGAMAKGMRIRPEERPSLEARLDRELAWADGLVDHALAGSPFGRAQITAASLLAPVARPDALPIYRRVRLPPDMEAAFGRWAERPILRWVRRAYAEHRRTA